MIGALINSFGIIAGGLGGLSRKNLVPYRYQAAIKIILGVFTVWFGLQLVWKSLNGSVVQVIKELCLVLVSMALGKLVGEGLRLQEFSNSVGRYATAALMNTEKEKKFSDGFVLATALFCAGPLGILGSVDEGLNGFSPVFWIKAAMDGLATLTFCATFGWSAIASAIPVLAFQGFLIRLVQVVEPLLRHQRAPVLDAINATDGLLVFCVALIILDVRKVRVASYLPSLIVAPLLMRWLW